MAREPERFITMETTGESFRFDCENGTFDLFDTSTGWTIISQATASVNSLFMKGRPVTASKIRGGYLFSAQFPEEKVLMELSVQLHQQKKVFVLEVHLTNMGNDAIPVESLSPLTIRHDLDGELLMGNAAFYQQGYQSWDGTQVISLPAKEPHIEGHWMAVLESRSAPSFGLMAGFTSFRSALSKIRVTYRRSFEAFEALTLWEGIPLAPGKKMTGEKFILSIAPSGLEALALWAECAALEMKCRPREITPAGWCSWYEAYEHIDEALILENIEKAGEMEGLTYFQIDDGYQKSEGDWLEAGEKFPSGMPFLMERIREKGLSPGIWVAPFMVGSNSTLFKKHSAWLIKDDKDNPLPLIEWRTGTMYGLDITHPGAQQWLDRLFRVMSGEWGVEFFKVDFLYIAAMAGKRHRKNWTGIQCLRKGLELIRDAVGERFITGCGAPLGPSMGLVDAMRISSDVGASWYGEFSLSRALKNTFSRSLFHRHLWINDPDCLIVRNTETGLTEEEVKTQVSIVALSGGIVSLSDSLKALSPDRRLLLSKVLPPFGVSARPTRLFSQRPLGVFDLRIERPFGAWHVVALVNHDDAPRDLTFDLAFTGMRQKEYLVYDIWNDLFLGVLRGKVSFRSVPPHGTKLIVVKTALAHPQLVATDLHLTSGGCEVSHYHYSPRTRELTVEIKAPGRRECSLIFHLPSRFRLKEITGTAETLDREDGLIEVKCAFTREFSTTLSFEREESRASR
ncbi:MAG: alpha-galactosidase [Candidatus Eremiobacteraeota bacterium]|nr:alpha-galactosidase [Candidatus Eremiobacteraeota bacterium]